MGIGIFIMGLKNPLKPLVIDLEAQELKQGKRHIAFENIVSFRKVHYTFVYKRYGATASQPETAIEVVSTPQQEVPFYLLSAGFRYSPHY